MPLNAEGTGGKISAMLFIPVNSDFCSGLLEKHVVDLEKSPAMKKDHDGRSSFRGWPGKMLTAFGSCTQSPARPPAARPRLRSPSLSCLSFSAHIKWKRDGATLAAYVIDGQEWDHRRSCWKLWHCWCVPQPEGYLPCIMDRMLSIFPVSQLACVPLAACFSKEGKGGKKKKKDNAKTSLWNSVTWHQNSFCILKEAFVCCHLPEGCRNTRGGQGKAAPFAVVPAQSKGTWPALLLPREVSSWGQGWAWK